MTHDVARHYKVTTHYSSFLSRITLILAIPTTVSHRRRFSNNKIHFLVFLCPSWSLKVRDLGTRESSPRSTIYDPRLTSDSILFHAGRRSVTVTPASQRHHRWWMIIRNRPSHSCIHSGIVSVPHVTAFWQLPEIGRSSDVSVLSEISG
jgi:hypothetical protein